MFNETTKILSEITPSAKEIVNETMKNTMKKNRHPQGRRRRPMCITVGDRRVSAVIVSDYKIVLEEGELSMQDLSMRMFALFEDDDYIVIQNPQVPLAMLAPPAVMQSLPPSGTPAK